MVRQENKTNNSQLSEKREATKIETKNEKKREDII